MRLLLTTSSASSGSVALGAGDRVVRLVVLDDEDLVAGDLDRVVEHRLDEGGQSCSSAVRDGLVQRGDARFGLAGGDGLAPASAVSAWARDRQQRRTSQPRRRDRRIRVSPRAQIRGTPRAGSAGPLVLPPARGCPSHTKWARLRALQSRLLRRARRLLVVAFDVRAPRLGLDRARRLPHHVELAVGLDLADEHRLVQVVVLLVHRRDDARRAP